MPTTVVGEDSTLLLEVQEIELLTSETMPDKLIWSGKFSSHDRVTLNGEHFMCTTPEILLNPPAGMSMYSFDKQFVLDMGVQMNEAPASSNTEITKKMVCVYKQIPTGEDESPCCQTYFDDRYYWKQRIWVMGTVGGLHVLPP